MILQQQAVVIPKFGQFPHLVDRENFFASEIGSYAPLVNPFFRLEEKHRCSGEDEVVVPVRKRKWKVDE